jgi:PAS domain S-box-containing protein
MDAAPIGITITGPSDADCPLIYLNERFEAMTGYRGDEVLGENCRFLQGPDTDPEPVRRMREAIEAEEEVTVTLKNYRKDGSAFWNRVTLAPVRDATGSVVNYVGFQEEVDEPTD